MLNPIALCMDDQDGNRKRRQVLLEFNVLVHCQENIEASGTKTGVDINNSKNNTGTVAVALLLMNSVMLMPDSASG